jgi:carbon monoxide dehydrogenase subunit G
MHVTVQRRVPAPQELVWHELGVNQRFVDTLPVEEATIEPDGRSAALTARIAFGPVAWTLRATAKVVEEEAPRRMVIDAGLDNQTVSMRGMLELSEGASDETVLSYDVELILAQNMPRMRRVFARLLEEHAVDLVDQTAAAAGRHWKAEQAMGAQAPTD